MTRAIRRGFRTRHFVRDGTLVVDLGARRSVLSSAVQRGGFARARYILNHEVPENPGPGDPSSSRWNDPTRHLSKVASGLGLGHACVGLMTAVALRQLVTVREERRGLWVEGFVTVGVTNAVRAGEPVADRRSASPASDPGTINIVLVTNARLTATAMVGAVQVMTESKTAALLRHGVPSWTGRPGATGTGTDATVIACGTSPLLRYSGTHTEIGGMIARVVDRAVTRGLRRSRRWTRRKNR